MLISHATCVYVSQCPPECASNSFVILLVLLVRAIVHLGGAHRVNGAPTCLQGVALACLIAPRSQVSLPLVTPLVTLGPSWVFILRLKSGSMPQ
ncbi:unnamed protein product [Citrullus colocynthis]|uniref:Uncharacterized protein n=1 Tax=Citrullus colocynthis TaxID=252529 RepID=A0ABP0YR80_9ROSI